MPTLTPTSTQNTEDGTALDGHVARVEDSPKIAELNDPYDFRNGIKSEADLAHMRKTKRGKGLESYHRKQNNVRLSLRSAGCSIRR